MSKVGVAANGDPLYTRGIFPGGGPFQEWELGSVFNLENASGSGVEISTINYIYFLSNAFNGAANHTFYAHIYSVNDANNDGFINDRTELTQIGLAESNLTGLGTTVPNGSYGTASFNNFTDPTGSHVLGELPSGKYYISIVTNPSLSGGATTFGSNDVPWLGASEEKDYNMNVGLTPGLSDFIINPSPLGYIDSAGSVLFSYVGFGATVIPSFGVEINTSRNSTIVDGSYSSGSTWSNGLVPVTNEPVFINNDVSVDSDLTLTGTTTINNSKSLSVEPGIVLTLDGTLDNSAGGDLVFKSDATGNGQLLINTGSSLSGPATVERFVPALDNTRRAFRFITPAVNSTGSIYENWQENGNTPAGFGTHITGSTTGANGFDQTASGNPSMFTYEHLNNSWEAVPNTNTNTLQAGKAYRILVRGDRNFDLSNTSQQNVNSNVVLRAKGSLMMSDAVYEGNVISGNDAGALSRQAGEFSLIGNPYQAIVDFESLPKSNINANFVYIWNANLGTDGAYETVDVSGAVDPRQYIQPGQAFFVVTDANGDSSLTFNEAAKTPSQFSNATFSTPSNLNYIGMVLSNDEGLVLDRLSIKFDGDNSIDNLDAPKLFNQYESLSSFTAGSNFSVEHRSLPIDDEILQLNLVGHNRSNYELSLDINLTNGLHAILIDNYLDSSTLLDEGVNTYSFNADNANSSSIDTNRFQIVFQNETLSINSVDLNVYPNPSENGVLSVSSTSLMNGKSSLELYNMMGQRVFYNNYENVTNGSIEIDTRSISSGSYILKIQSDKINTAKKVVIK